MGISHKPYLGRCCVVWLYPEVERYVPVDATDLEFDPRQIHPTPLSIAAVESLLRVFEQIQSSQPGGATHVCSPDSSAAVP